MKTRVITRIGGMLALAVLAGSLAWLTPTPAVAQGAAKSKYKAPRWDDKKTANLQGIWIVDAWDTSRYGLEWHGAGTGIRPGKGSITNPANGMIPYKPEARKLQETNYANRLSKEKGKGDPMGLCFMTGVPRFVTSGFPFQIIQTPKYIMLASEFTHMLRYVYMERKEHKYNGDLEFWLGDSIGKWEGDTLVVDTWNQLADTWLDASGSPHSTALKVVERFTRTGENTMDYTATMTDPETMTAPVTINLTLHRNTHPGAQLMEYECHSYAEDDAKMGH